MPSVLWPRPPLTLSLFQTLAQEPEEGHGQICTVSTLIHCPLVQRNILTWSAVSFYLMNVCKTADEKWGGREKDMQLCLGDFN